MSRWRCAICKEIVDIRIWPKDSCPNCSSFDPCEEWVNLEMEECEKLWEEQRKKLFNKE